MMRCIRVAILCLLASDLCLLGAGIPRAIAAPPHDGLTIQLAVAGSASHRPVITAIAVDPTGQLIAASGDDHIIRILRRSDLRPVQSLAGHTDWVRSLDFSPDGRYLASAGHDGRLILWDRHQDWKPSEATKDAPALGCARFSPDGRMVAAVGFAPQLHLIGVGTDLRPKLNCGCRDLRAVAYRADGSILAAAGRSGDAHLFDAVTGASLGEIPLHRGRIRAMQFIGDTGRLVTAGEAGHVIVFDTDSRRVVQDLEIPGCKLLAACMVDGRHLAVGGSDNLIRVFDVETGEQIQELGGHTGSVAALVAFDGDLYSGGFDTTLRVWQLHELGSGQRVAEADAVPQPEARTSRRP